jgi:hypothetical protein
LHASRRSSPAASSKRVALGRAIIAQAPVCLMDEPLSNLGAQLRAEMRQEIRALQRKLGITRGDPAWLSWPPGAQHYFDGNGARAPVPGCEAAVTMFA